MKLKRILSSFLAVVMAFGVVSLATVDENGNIVATGIGDTVITISTSDGKTKNVNVNVKFLAMAVSFGKNKISLSEGNSKITANKTGKTTVSCTTANGVTVRCLVYVTKGVQSKIQKA